MNSCLILPCHVSANVGMWNVISVTFEVFTAVTMKNAVFWDVAPCSTYVNWCSSETSVRTRTARRRISENCILQVWLVFVKYYELVYKDLEDCLFRKQTPRRCIQTSWVQLHPRALILNKRASLSRDLTCSAWVLRRQYMRLVKLTSARKLYDIFEYILCVWWCMPPGSFTVVKECCSLV
jgi:hypothetical protein